MPADAKVEKAPGDSALKQGVTIEAKGEEKQLQGDWVSIFGYGSLMSVASARRRTSWPFRGS